MPKPTLADSSWQRAPIAEPHTWLARVGWRRGNLCRPLLTEGTLWPEAFRVRCDTPEKLRTLQEVLGAKAKQEPSYRFYALYDKVYRDDVLLHAWALSRRKNGALGVDGKAGRRKRSDGPRGESSIEGTCSHQAPPVRTATAPLLDSTGAAQA